MSRVPDLLGRRHRRPDPQALYMGRRLLMLTATTLARHFRRSPRIRPQQQTFYVHMSTGAGSCARIPTANCTHDLGASKMLRFMGFGFPIPMALGTTSSHLSSPSYVSTIIQTPAHAPLTDYAQSQAHWSPHFNSDQGDSLCPSNISETQLRRQLRSCWLDRHAHS